MAASPSRREKQEHPEPEPVALEGARESELANEPSRLRRALKVLGPGLITGASDDDPSGIGTYSAAGASLGFATLWTVVITFPLMAAVQFICAKVGLASGMGLAAVLRRYYPRYVLYPALIGLMVANTINAGADIGAIAAALNLLVPIPVVALVLPVTLVVVGLMIWGSYRLIANVFKWLTLALFAYVGASLLARPDAGAVLKGTFIPTVSLDPAFLATLVAILGTTISPYLFFWQASQEVEEKVSMGRHRLWQRRGTTDNELKYAFWDINTGMFFSNLVAYFIIMATGATLFMSGKNDIGTATEAAQALRPLAGDAALVLFAIGMVGSGFLAVPILVASSAYALSETFRWRHGLDENPTRAWQFYAAIVVSMLIGMEINFIGINPISALFWTAVINGVLAPPLLVLIMLVANNRDVMGERVNGPISNIMGWVTAAAMFAAAIGLAATWGH
ncbi:MAG TPA: divalent metal cation transporter [Chloroflexota bacterium]